MLLSKVTKSSLCLYIYFNVQEVAEYFTNYILNDSLGIISNAHTVFADKEPFKARSEACIELARLSSIAVDFPKTGIPAKIPHNLRVQQYPDFMEKPDRLTYESQSVIGKLYREVKKFERGASTGTPHFTKEVAEQSYDSDLEVDGYLDYVNDALHCKTEYDSKLANLMRYYGVRTEAEMISGCITKMSKSFDRRRDLETVVLAVKSLRKEAKGWFNEKPTNELLGSNVQNLLAKASAWYHVTYRVSTMRPQIKSISLASHGLFMTSFSKLRGRKCLQRLRRRKCLQSLSHP